MAKFCGRIGYTVHRENSLGVFVDDIFERHHRGDVIRQVNRWENGQWLNDDINVSNQFSIIADDYILKHCHMMRYVEWMNARWKITSIDVKRPRVILTIGGVYNGPIPSGATC